MPLYPLKFKPRLLEKMWGGRKIQTVLGKPLPPGQLIGESWELYDFPPGVVEDSKHWVSSEVANGPLAGHTLHKLIEEFGTGIYGDVRLVGPHRQFPVLIKFLDAAQDLSVQVHPDRAYAAKHPGAHLKSEAWYIVHRDPGSRLLKDLRTGITREAFGKAITDGTVESMIDSIPVEVGQSFYLPSGTVHALGAGILAAEVQTPSDTTFRVFDFNRIEPSTGKPRKLHVEQALQCINFQNAAPIPPTTGAITSEFFKMEPRKARKGSKRPISKDQPVIWIVLEGEVELKLQAYTPTSIVQGETVLLPPGMRHPIAEAKTDCSWIEVSFPV